MNNYNIATNVAEKFREFNDLKFKNKIIDVEDLWCVAEYVENTALANLQTKQSFLPEDEDVIASNFLMPLTKGKWTSFLLIYFPYEKDFDIDVCTVYDKNGIPTNDHPKNMWIDDEIKGTIRKTRLNRFKKW